MEATRHLLVFISRGGFKPEERHDLRPQPAYPRVSCGEKMQ